jgi:hypothetical protein
MFIIKNFSILGDIYVSTTRSSLELDLLKKTNNWELEV